MSGLNVGISWLELLEELGCPSNSRILPALAGCPLCKTGALRVYHDLRASWFRCDQCRFSGTAFDLAKACWKRPDQEVLSRLSVEGLLVGDNQSDNLQKYQQRKKRYGVLESIWTESRRDPDWTVLSDQLNKIYRSPVTLRTDWQQIEGNWVAACEVSKFRTAVRGIPLEDLPPKWKQMLIVPLEEMPGRVAGFWCYSDQQKATLLRSPVKRLRDRTCLFGLGELSGLNYKTVVVSTDLEFVLRSQLLSLRELYKPAPLLGAVIKPTPNPIWRQLGSQFVFWVKRLTPDVVREAASCQARISTFQELPRGMSQASRLLGLAEKAGSWQQAVDQHLATLSPASGCEFVKEIGLPPLETRELLADCRATVQNPILALLSSVPDSVQYGRHTVSADGSRLFVDGKLAADAVIRLKSINEDDDPVYNGEISFRRSVIKFKTRASAMETRTETWLRQQLWKRGLGVPFVAAPWRAHLVPLAHLLGNPEYVTRRPAAGWNEQEQGLVVSKYCLRRGGAIKWYEGNAPRGVHNLGPPLPLSAKAIAALSAVPDIDTFWAVLASVVANLLSPVLGVSPQPLLLCGRSDFDTTILAAKACGCQTGTLHQSKLSLDQLVTSGRKNNWPVLLTSSKTSLRVGEGVPALRGGLSGTILRVRNQFRGVLMAAGSGCDLVINRAPAATAAIEEFGGDILPAYLQDLARRNFNVRSEQTSPLQRVLDDVLEWWAEQGGLLPPRNCIWSGTEVWLHVLTEIMADRVHNIRSVPRGFGDSVELKPVRSSQFVVETDSQHLYLPILQLQELLLKRRCALDLIRMREGLAAGGYLRQILEGDVWMLPVSVWDLVIQKRNSTAPVLKTA